MTAEATRCSRCNGQMMQGFPFQSQVPERIVSTWVEGAPEKSFWEGTKLALEKCIPVVTFRCSAPGFLESFSHISHGGV